MTSLTQPLREEHRHLLPHIQSLESLADSIGTSDASSIWKGVDAACEFLTWHLVPHAEAEDQALYPVVARVIGAPNATATMSRDHVEIGRLTRELAALRLGLNGVTMSDAQKNELRRILYGLYAILILHFAKEEEVYLPLLDARLSGEEARSMFVAMEDAAGKAKSG